jgi:hypothetical protein
MYSKKRNETNLLFQSSPEISLKSTSRHIIVKEKEQNNEGLSGGATEKSFFKEIAYHGSYLLNRNNGNRRPRSDIFEMIYIV